MSVLDIVFPKRCLTCKKEGKYICGSCLSKVRYSQNQENIISIWNYEGVIKQAILALKYKFAFEVGEELAKLTILELKRKNFSFPKNLILVPVPLHKQRQNWRGFNQAEMMGKKIAKDFGWKFNPDLIAKTEASQPQVELAKEERLRNLRGKFAVNHAWKEKIEPDFFYVIFDDVATTGSTIKEVEKVLKENGAKETIGLTMAS
ncbi:MAG TPA: ComF family protein [Patescibacteria group bacterium]